MKKIFKRLRSRAGESLVESMAAILIFTMGSIILLSMVSTAADINKTASETDESYNSQILAAEMSAVKHEATGTVTVSINNNVNKDTRNVKIFRENQDALYTYYTSDTITGGSG